MVDTPKGSDGGKNTGLRARLIRDGKAGVVLRVLSLLAGLVSATVLARLMGPQSYGIYAFVFSLITMLALPVKMGLPTLILRETARADQAGDGALMTGIWRWSARVMIGMSACVILAVLAYLLIFSSDELSPRMSALLWALPLIPLLGFAEATSAATRGLRRLFLSGMTDRIFRPLLLATAVMGLYALSANALTVEVTFFLHSIAAAMTLIAAGVILYRVKPQHAGMDKPRTTSRAWIVTVLPLAAIGGLQMISHNTDILMIGLLSTDTDVGLYRVALSGANIALFGLTTANMILQPYFARAWQADNMRQMQKLAAAGSRISTVASLPILIVFYLFGTWLLTTVFGDAYVGAYWALILLCVGQTASALFGSVGSLLTMAGRERVALVGIGISTIVNIALNWILIPLYGIEGAAIATGCSIIVWNLCLWGAAIKLMGIDSSVVGLRLQTKATPPPAQKD